MISSKSIINYKQKNDISFRPLLGALLPIIHSEQITSMRYSALPLFWQKDSKTLRGKQEIDMKHKMKTHCGAQWISLLCCAYTKTKKY